jgi:hypothetical protein
MKRINFVIGVLILGSYLYLIGCGEVTEKVTFQTKQKGSFMFAFEDVREVLHKYPERFPDADSVISLIEKKLEEDTNISFIRGVIQNMIFV